MRVRSGESEAVAPPASLGETTLFFTDIEGSTSLLEELGDDTYAELLGVHHQVIRAAIAAHHGEERGTEGDSFFATFPRPVDGVAAAVGAQRDLGRADWPAGVRVSVRMGLHHGPVALVGGNLVGMAIHMAARIEAAAHGGQIVVSPAVALDLDGSVPLRALGTHRLRGIAGRTELFQVDLPDLSSDFPPLRTEPSDSVPVPRYLAAFVGRSDELVSLRRLHEASRLVTITGPPGVGKTRLAATLLDGQQDVAFVDLTSIEDPSLVADRMAAAVGTSGGGEEGALDAFVRHLGAVPFVMLLDNCEHVVDAVAEVVGAIVARTGAVRFVCTSREPLAIDGEVVWPLRPLAEAEELFVARARAADASTDLTSDDPRVVAICERLDRLPLAVELAAAQVGRMPVGELVARMDELGGVLRSGRRDVPARHRTLLDAIDWSVRLLDPEEQRAFRRLAVMWGPFDLAAAEAVTGASPEVIAALHERSLLSVGDRATWGRFRMLQTVRDVAAELLEAAGERAAAEAAHATAFQDRASQRVRGLRSSVAAGLEVVDEDGANYQKAVDWLAVHDPGRALALAVDVEPLWTTRLSATVGGELFERILAAATDAPAERRASALLILADLDRNRGRVHEARRAAEAALELSAEMTAGDQFAAAVMLGQILAMQGQLDQALDLMEQNLALSRERDDVAGIVSSLREIANVAVEQNRPADAEGPLAEATRLAATDDASRWMLGILMSDRARAALALGRLDEARAEYESSMAMGQQLGIPRAIAGCSIGLAQVMRAQGSPRGAEPLLREAERFYRDEQDAGGLAHVYVEAALVNSALGQHEATAQLLGAAQAVRERIGLATPGSEEPAIRAARARAEAALGAATAARLEQAGRAASPDDLLASF